MSPGLTKAGEGMRKTLGLSLQTEAPCVRAGPAVTDCGTVSVARHSCGGDSAFRRIARQTNAAAQTGRPGQADLPVVL
ncbi:unnamed protein product [Gadus morhua 'NCC']